VRIADDDLLDRRKGENHLARSSVRNLQEIAKHRNPLQMLIDLIRDSDGSARGCGNAPTVGHPAGGLTLIINNCVEKPS
jgi:hypothetical protein